MAKKQIDDQTETRHEHKETKGNKESWKQRETKRSGKNAGILCKTITLAGLLRTGLVAYVNLTVFV